MLAHKAIIIVMMIILKTASISATYGALAVARRSPKCIISFHPRDRPVSVRGYGPRSRDEETEADRVQSNLSKVM